jgi:4'-phosphopantetheinyl transferase
METRSGFPILGDDEVHVWRAWLDLGTTSLALLAGILSADERRRAVRFRRDPDCHRFVAAHAILRLILGSYLDIEPAKVVFTFGRFGKPVVGLSDGSAPLHFNLSHSHGLALYAVSRTFEVGIDIEHVQPRLASLHLAEQFLPLEDVSRLRKLSPPQWPEAFFQAWTRMEAREKASGKGLALTLVPATGRCGLQPFRGQRAEAAEETGVSAKNLAIHDGYAAALAVDRDGYTVRYVDWTDSFDALTGDLGGRLPEAKERRLRNPFL